MDSFGFHKAWKRRIVLVAGVAMNVLLAAALFSVGFTIGIPTDVSSGIPEGAIVVGTPSVMIQEVVKGSAAEEAGLKFGDTIMLLDEQPVAGASAFTDYVQRHTEQELVLRIKRGEEEMTVKATPRPSLGVILADAAIIRYPWYAAVPQGFVAAGSSLIGIFILLYILVKELILGQGLAFEVSGPVGIASIVGQSARLGIQYLIHVTAMISLSLAAMNILPIPALDGGRVLFVLIEKLIRRPVPMKYEQLAHTIGFVLLLILIVIVTGRDILGLVR
jgi:regulator of sigma E protease